MLDGAAAAAAVFEFTALVSDEFDRARGAGAGVGAGVTVTESLSGELGTLETVSMVLSDADWVCRWSSVGGMAEGGAVVVCREDEVSVEIEEAEAPLVFVGAVPDLVELPPLLWERSFHLRQPSKSIRACMQPHSMTFRSSQRKLTG